MITRKLASALAALALTVAGVLAFNGPAHATTDSPSVAKADADCGVDLTFTNPTRWPFSFDYRVDGEQPSAAVEEELKDLTVKEGPRAGLPFEPRYRVVNVPAGGSETVNIRFDTAGGHKVAYWLNRGPEQHMFLTTVSVEVDVPESCVPELDPEVTPPATPTPTPAATSPTAVPPADDDDQGSGGGLPVTGVSGPVLLGVGVAAVAAGFGLVLLVRRRRRVTFTT